MDCYPAVKKEQTIDKHNSTTESQKHYAVKETKYYILSDSKYITF